MNGINASSLIRFGSISFSDKEIIDIIRAWLAISFAFAMILSDGFSGLFPAFILASLTVGIGFIAHEMGHKIAAQHYGAWAEFRAWNLGLLLAVALSFLGFIIAAPGAVIIQGRTIGKSRYGKVAAAGPVMSYITAIAFLGLKVLFPSGMLANIGSYGFMINTWLGLFNMIPLFILDGKKIWNWNKAVYFILVGIGIGLLFVR